MRKTENPLVGKTIAAVWLAKDKKAVRFALADGGEVVARTDGDCCSDSWIESLDTPELLVGGRVTAVEDLDLPEAEESDYGVIARYGCKITTTKGACVIDFRNESNGYYGGNIAWPGDYFYGGVFEQNVSAEEWGEPLGP